MLRRRFELLKARLVFAYFVLIWSFVFLKPRSDFEKLQSSAEIVEKLEIERENTIALLRDKANQLTAERKKIAQIFVTKVKENLAELSMKNAKFEIVFDAIDENICDETGFDKIEFMFTANSGQPLKQLSKVASGGEMSRFMLGVKNVTADIVCVHSAGSYKACRPVRRRRFPQCRRCIRRPENRRAGSSFPHCAARNRSSTRRRDRCSHPVPPVRTERRCSSRPLPTRRIPHPSRCVRVRA